MTQPLDDAEHAIERMVRLFYERGRADPVLAPIFNAAVLRKLSHVATNTMAAPAGTHMSMVSP